MKDFYFDARVAVCFSVLTCSFVVPQFKSIFNSIDFEFFFILICNLIAGVMLHFAATDATQCRSASLSFYQQSPPGKYFEQVKRALSKRKYYLVDSISISTNRRRKIKLQFACDFCFYLMCISIAFNQIN